MIAALTFGLLVLSFGLLIVPARASARGRLRRGGLGALVAAFLVALVFGTFLGLALGLGFLTTVALAIVMIRVARAVGNRPVRCGAEGLVGHVGVVRRSLDPLGEVAVGGELWRARRSWADEDEPMPAEGDAVVIDRVHGLTLCVRPAEPWEVEP
jgi:membrane protein implicated in regulation of membrane protease activity